MLEVWKLLKNQERQTWSKDNNIRRLILETQNQDSARHAGEELAMIVDSQERHHHGGELWIDCFWKN